jgi:hypothetical protein
MAGEKQDLNKADSEYQPSPSTVKSVTRNVRRKSSAPLHNDIGATNSPDLPDINTLLRGIEKAIAEELETSIASAVDTVDKEDMAPVGKTEQQVVEGTYLRQSDATRS